jgi:hypothetical protein
VNSVIKQSQTSPKTILYVNNLTKSQKYPVPRTERDPHPPQSPAECNQPRVGMQVDTSWIVICCTRSMRLRRILVQFLEFWVDPKTHDFFVHMHINLKKFKKNRTYSFNPISAIYKISSSNSLQFRYNQKEKFLINLSVYICQKFYLFYYVFIPKNFNLKFYRSVE